MGASGRQSRQTRLTDRVVERAGYLGDGREPFFVRDGDPPGFGLRIQPTGAKSFFVEARVRRGASKRITIGPFPEFSVAAARTKALELRRSLREGVDPIAAAREEVATRERLERSAPRLGDLTERWLEDARRRKRSWAEDQQRIRDYLGPWLNRKVADIAPDELPRLLERIAEDRGPYAANRTFALLRAILRRARTEWRVLQADQPLLTDGVRPYREQPRKRDLTRAELARLLAAIAQEADPRWRSVFVLSLLLGTRREELLSRDWSDVDFDHPQGPRLRLDAASTKSGEPRWLPLPGAAVRILREWLEPAARGPLFPSHGSTGRLREPKKAWARVLARADLDDLRLHDLRHLTATLAAAAGTSLRLVQQVLGHARIETTSRYAHAQIEATRQPLEELAADIETLLPAGEGDELRASQARFWEEVGALVERACDAFPDLTGPGLGPRPHGGASCD